MHTTPHTTPPASTRSSKGRQRLAALSLVIGLTLSAGCSTIYSYANGRVAGAPDYAPSPDFIYSGVRTDVEWFGLPYVPALLYVVIDFPFSFVLDTAALPVTLVLRLFAEPGFTGLSDSHLASLAVNHEDPDVRADAQAEIDKRKAAGTYEAD